MPPRLSSLADAVRHSLRDAKSELRRITTGRVPILIEDALAAPAVATSAATNTPA